jgi:hypothetical protein
LVNIGWMKSIGETSCIEGTVGVTAEALMR